VLLFAKPFGQNPCGHRAGDDGQEGGQLEHAVAPGETLFRQQLGERTVFRGGEKRRLRAEQKDGRNFQGQQVQAQAQKRDAHYRRFHPFCADRDGAFAESVGQPPSGHREENERCGEDDQHDGDQIIAGIGSQPRGREQIDDQEFERVFVEGAGVLRRNQGPEPARGSRGLAEDFGRAFAGHARAW
jgi:hypothetical protein